MINTVLNINDSYSAGILDNFNVSRDEILRRISTALQPAPQSHDNARSSMIGEHRNIESDTNPTPVGTDVDKQE